MLLKIEKLLPPTITGSIAIVIGLIGVCMGFFMVHAAAVGALNKKLSSGHGRANALYVLFYYIGGGLGITTAGFAYKQGGWTVMILLMIEFAGSKRFYLSNCQ